MRLLSLLNCITPCWDKKIQVPKNLWNYRASHSWKLIFSSITITERSNPVLDSQLYFSHLVWDMSPYIFALFEEMWLYCICSPPSFSLLLYEFYKLLLLFIWEHCKANMELTWNCHWIYSGVNSCKLHDEDLINKRK